MKLYYSPNACSIGIHVILEEIGAPFTLEKLDLAHGAQHKPPFSEINPKGKVPTLERDDGGIVTEFPAIAFYLARSFPKAKLLPGRLPRAVKALELMDYMVATVHMRGFTRIFRPGNFTPSPADEDKVKAAGQEVVAQGLLFLAAQLKDKDYLLGDYSIADATLFFIEYWAKTRAGMALPEKIAAHLQRMMERPAVQRVLAAEGLA